MHNSDINSRFFYLGGIIEEKKIEERWGYRGALVTIQDH